jgi:hypothetical protein
MPTDVWFWIVVAVLIAALMALAVWKNRGINVELGPNNVKIGTQATIDASPPAVTKVAEGMTMAENAKAGDIVGREGQSDIDRTIEVAKQLSVGKNAEVGDIIGDRIVGPDRPRR